MPLSRPRHDTAEEYRRRADDARHESDTMKQPQARQMMLDTAALWQRMAGWEEKYPRPDYPAGAALSGPWLRIGPRREVAYDRRPKRSRGE